eukprot:351323-Chlamydomonas_euryale.AAC.22
MQIYVTLENGENLLSSSVAEPEPDASEERDPHTSGAQRLASPAVRFRVRASFASAVFLA